MGNNFANTDGSLSDRSAAYYEARAKGGFGLITIESTVVYKEAKGGPRKPCLFSDDAVVPSFKARGRPPATPTGPRSASSSSTPAPRATQQAHRLPPEGRQRHRPPALRPRDPGGRAPTEEVYRLIECYGDAARRAQLAGIDMVEVHCAHGYLVSTFISAAHQQAHRRVRRLL